MFIIKKVNTSATLMMSMLLKQPKLEDFLHSSDDNRRTASCI